MAEEDELNFTKRFADRTESVIWSHNRSPALLVDKWPWR